MSKREEMDLVTRRQVVIDVLSRAVLDLKLGNLPKKPEFEGPIRKTAWVELTESHVDQRSHRQDPPGDRD